MDDAIQEKLNFVSAKLTGNLEDAKSLAASGQNPRLSADEAAELDPVDTDIVDSR